MRALVEHELGLVVGAEGQCTPGNSSAELSIPDRTSMTGQNITPLYEAIVAATSQLIEKVANSFK